MRASASLATLPSPREKKARLDGAKRIRVVVRKRPLVQKELDAELGPLPKKRGRDLPIPGGAQVAEDRGLDPPPSLEEQARMASALATPRLPGTTAGPL